MTFFASLRDKSHLFKNRPFAILWSGQTLLGFGDAIFRVAQVALLLKLGGSAAQLSGLLLSAVLPALILSLVGGTLADRADRRLILLWGYATRALFLVVFALLIASGHIALWHLYALAILQSCVGALANPSFDALLPSIVPKDQLVSANALFMLGDNMAALAGPALGGALLYFLGFTGMVSINAGAALLMVLFLSLLPKKTATSEETTSNSFFKDLLGSFVYAKANPSIVTLLSFFAVANITASVLAVSLPLLVTEVYQKDVAFYGLFLTVMNLGILLGIAGMQIVKIKAYGKAIAIASILQACLGYIVLGTSHSVYLGLVAVLFIDGFSMVSNVIYPSYVQSSVPDEYRGRIFGLTGMMSYSLVPVGYVLAGVGTSTLGAAPSLLYSGLALLLVGVLGLFSPALRKVRAAT